MKGQASRQHFPTAHVKELVNNYNCKLQKIYKYAVDMHMGAVLPAKGFYSFCPASPEIYTAQLGR